MNEINKDDYDVEALRKIQVNDQTTEPSEPITFYRPLHLSADVAAAVDAAADLRALTSAADHFGVGGINEREYVHLPYPNYEYEILEVLYDDDDNVSLGVLSVAEMARLHDALFAQFARVARGDVLS